MTNWRPPSEPLGHISTADRAGRSSLRLRDRIGAAILITAGIVVVLLVVGAFFYLTGPG